MKTDESRKNECHNAVRIIALFIVLMLVFTVNALALDGRIAISSDGNQHDPDDWASSPMELAIIEAYGAKNKLVHFDYCDHINESDPDMNDPFMEREMDYSVLTAAELFKYDKSLFFNCARDLDGAVNSIKNAVNASSSDNPLLFIVAGPMEVPYRGIKAAHPSKRQYVTCISHSPWNNVHDEDRGIHSSKDIVDLGAKWTQIAGQKYLAPKINVPDGSSHSYRPFFFLRDSNDPRLSFLWTRFQKECKGDCSDSGMAYYLFTGDEECTPDKLESLLVKNSTPAPGPVSRPYFNVFTDTNGIVSLEAENFSSLEKQETRQWIMQLPFWAWHPQQGTAKAYPRVGDLGYLSTRCKMSSGGIYMEILPDGYAKHSDNHTMGEDIASSPGQLCVMNYKIRFSRSGRYYVWLRGYGDGNGEDDSIYAGMDGNYPSDTEELLIGGNKKWDWKNQYGAGGRASIDVPSEGMHTLNIAMKDDGAELDKIVLAASPSYSPSGFGPPQTLYDGRK